MKHIIIDRRKNDKGKSTDNRNRFIKRVSAQVKESLKKVISEDGSIMDITGKSGKKIKIPGKGLNKPVFHHDRHGGIKHIVVPGNKEYVTGDRIRRQGSGEGEGGEGSAGNSGEGEDGFSFELTQKEFMDMFFEDLELPNLTKRNLSITEEFISRRAGFAPEGTKLNITRTMGKARGRRVALRAKKRKKLAELEQQYNALLKQPVLNDDEQKELRSLKRQIEEMKRRIKRVPFIDTTDELYNRWEQVPIPTTKAVMFCLMDVSGSMQKREKELSKRFFMLLYWFLRNSYERVDIRFVRHTQIAKEVDEQEFFYSRETGGTVVSSGLELIDEIIKKDYNLNEWNIYTCQASDGDNWPDDSKVCTHILSERLLPSMQYFAYLEIPRLYTMFGGSPQAHTELWNEYKRLKDSHDNFDMVQISKSSEIFPVFEKLFEKRGV